MLKPILTSATIALALSATPTLAQGYGGAPGGSYLDSCRNVRVLGGSLEADCRTTNGSWQRTGLRLSDCSGDIANQNGHLTCGGGRGGYGSSYGPRDRGYGPGPYNDYDRGGYNRGGYGYSR
jgi:CVNH domain